MLLLEIFLWVVSLEHIYLFPQSTTGAAPPCWPLLEPGLFPLVALSTGGRWFSRWPSKWFCADCAVGPLLRAFTGAFRMHHSQQNHQVPSSLRVLQGAAVGASGGHHCGERHLRISLVVSSTTSILVVTFGLCRTKHRSSPDVLEGLGGGAVVVVQRAGFWFQKKETSWPWTWAEPTSVCFWYAYEMGCGAAWRCTTRSTQFQKILCKEQERK